MNKDDIKKALEYCVTYKNVDCNNCPYCPYDGQILCQDVLCKDALTLITEQEKEIERLKDENKENCWKCIEAKRVTEEDYAKLQEEFANYQIASDKEMIAQVKQAVKEFAEKLKEYAIACKASGYDGIGENDIDELLKEYEDDKRRD